jgi:hypothetical protein
MRQPPTGSVLLLGVLFFSVISAGLFVYLSAAGMLHDKHRGQHLADMAALSVASWQAQTLNYQAYANRAIVANELMMAQSLTLLSYVQHVESLTGQTAQLASLWPGFRDFAQVLHATAQATREVATVATKAEIPFRSGYSHALLASQTAIHKALTPFAAQALVNEAVWSADRRYFGQTLSVPSNPSFFWAVEQSSPAQQEKNARFLEGALEPYSQDRSFDSAAWFFPNVGCLPRQASHLLGRLVREGSTRMSTDQSAWIAQDTLSLHRWRAGGWLRVCRGTRELWPLSWGMAVAASDDRLISPASQLTRNPAANLQASTAAEHIQGYLGLTRLHHLTDSNAGVDQTFRVPVAVRLSREKSKAMDYFYRLSKVERAPQALWSMAVGLTEFRPPRGEHAELSIARGTTHLYPFWHARLASPNLAEQAVFGVTTGAGN